MKQRILAAMTAMAVAAGSLTISPACAHAEPIAAPVVPQAEAPCSEKLAGALTRLPDGQTLLECRSVPAGYQWEAFTGPYPASERWHSYGPELTLQGQGRRNPEIMSGEWIGSPLDAGSQCGAEQAAIVGAGPVGPPQISSGEVGQPLEFEVLPAVVSITMTGYCLWQKRDV